MRTQTCTCNSTRKHRIWATTHTSCNLHHNSTNLQICHTTTNTFCTKFATSRRQLSLYHQRSHKFKLPLIFAIIKLNTTGTCPGVAQKENKKLHPKRQPCVVCFLQTNKLCSRGPKCPTKNQPHLTPVNPNTLHNSFKCKNTSWGNAIIESISNEPTSLHIK